MKAVTRIAGNTALALLGLASGALFQPAPAAAAVPALPSLVAYVRSGDVYVSKGATETRLTTGRRLLPARAGRPTASSSPCSRPASSGP